MFSVSHRENFVLHMQQNDDMTLFESIQLTTFSEISVWR